MQMLVQAHSTRVPCTTAATCVSTVYNKPPPFRAVHNNAITCVHVPCTNMQMLVQAHVPRITAATQLLVQL